MSMGMNEKKGERLCPRATLCLAAEQKREACRETEKGPTERRVNAGKCGDPGGHVMMLPGGGTTQGRC